MELRFNKTLWLFRCWWWSYGKIPKAMIPNGTFHRDGNILGSVLPIMVAPGHIEPLSSCNVASATEELNLIKCNHHLWLVATILGSEELEELRGLWNWLDGWCHSLQQRIQKKEDMGEKTMNSRWTSYVSSEDNSMTGRWQLLNTWSKGFKLHQGWRCTFGSFQHGGWAAARPSTIPPRTPSGPLLVLSLSAFLQSAKIPFRA